MCVFDVGIYIVRVQAESEPKVFLSARLSGKTAWTQPCQECNVQIWKTSWGQTEGSWCRLERGRSIDGIFWMMSYSSRYTHTETLYLENIFLIMYNVPRTWSRLLISVSHIGPLVAEFLGNIQLWVCLMLHPFVNVSWRKDAFLVICDTESWGLRGNSGQVPRPSRNELPVRGLWSYIGVVLICVEFAAQWAGNPDGQKWMLTKYMGEDAEGAWRLHDNFVNDLVDSDWMKGFVDSGRLWVDSAFLWFGQSKGKHCFNRFPPWHVL